MIKTAILVFLLLFLFCQDPLYPSDTSNELFVYGGLDIFMTNGVGYQNRFIVYSGTGWSGQQDIQYKTAPRFNIGGGFIHWFSSRLGIQVLGHYQPLRLDLKSESTHIHYTFSRWAPYYPWPEEEVDETFNSPESPSGSYKQLCFGVNMALRFDINALSVIFAGGPCLYHIFSGELKDLYFQNSDQISRGQIITSTALITAEMESRTQLGANLAMRAQLSLSSGMHLFVEGRYFLSPKTDLKLNLVGVEEIYYSFHADSPEEIEPLLELKPIQLEPSFFCLCVGISILL